MTTSCEAAVDLAQDLARRPSDRTLAGDPTKDRARRLDGSHGGESSIPFAMSGDNDNVDFNTSLTQWGSALTAADLESLKQAQTAAGADVALPKVAGGRAPKFDLWAQGRRARFSEPGSKHGDALTTSVGADYRWDRNLLIGGMVQVDGSHQSILAAPDASAGTAYLAGPYLAYRLSPNVMLDAKAAWGMAHDSAMAGSESLDLVSGRMLDRSAPDRQPRAETPFRDRLGREYRPFAFFKSRPRSCRVGLERTGGPEHGRWRHPACQTR